MNTAPKIRFPSGEYLLILVGSILYAFSTVVFIFPSGLLSGVTILISSVLGLLVKTLGIDFVISIYQKHQKAETGRKKE